MVLEQVQVGICSGGSGQIKVLFADFIDNDKNRVLIISKRGSYQIVYEIYKIDRDRSTVTLLAGSSNSHSNGNSQQSKVGVLEDKDSKVNEEYYHQWGIRDVTGTTTARTAATLSNAAKRHVDNGLLISLYC